MLDVIAEKASNIEFININQSRRETLERNISILGKRESILREATVTVTHNKQGEKIIEQLEHNWVEKREQAPLVYWQDLEKLYVQFPNNDIKMEFLLYEKEHPMTLFAAPGASVDEVNKTTDQHLTRKPVKCEIANVNPRITTTKLNNILNLLIHDGNRIINIREGKQHGPNKNRTIMFTTNAIGLRKIIGELDGAIQYNQISLNIKTKLNIKINCKPWQCKKCYKLGRHECPGELCANCGMKDHAAKNCISKRKHCNNCNKPGHRAKDAHCMVYQNEVIKELRKMDIPLEYLTVKHKREELINILQYN